MSSDTLSPIVTPCPWCWPGWGDNVYRLWAAHLETYQGHDGQAR